MLRPISLSLCALLALAACANDLRVDHPFDGATVNGPLVSAQVLDAGVIYLAIDATTKGSQVYVDLDQSRELKADEAFATNAWDLAFQRYVISMNGGAGNPTGTVAAAVLKGQAFDTLTQAPKSGYQQDGANPVFDDAEGGWYTYDLGAHKLVTRDDLIYVVRSSEGKYYKVKMLSYYDATGTPAALSLLYAAVQAP